jgi:hypothetical protein
MEHSWPVLNYKEWQPTLETLLRWVQVIGKIRLCKSPPINHSWNTTLYVTSRGLTTSAIPLEERNLTISFDFLNHNLILQDSLGSEKILSLKEESVSAFYHRVMETLGQLGVTVSFDPSPNEVVDAIPFADDTFHRTYNRIHAHRYWQALVRIDNVLQKFRSNFVGKSSPVHFFWGSFDLAITRFSGRRAPEHPGGIPHLSDEVVREAYSHEVMSCGFWPGNEMYPHAAFYAYAYPEPGNFSKARIMPPEAFYNTDLHEFILPYDVVRTAENPEAIILSFVESAYRAVANLGQWDRDLLEVSPHLLKIKELSLSSFGGEATRQ